MLATVLVSVGLASLVVLVIIGMVKNKKVGKTACGCGCGSCPMSGHCHNEK